ncbi:KR domain-containing protein [Kitasatospora sp. A2-31]|uniref:KR domain-containing protein n=1 Tax=Kitasatospora sp. A2-31 TaxID=2916414 RepID=UPI001EECA410|nr:KR domain-containing protein [Kitasatospora sp. A2-31]MCG6498072.1 KR domain-containing protein [Kitasatospora sp. A2-31]
MSTGPELPEPSVDTWAAALRRAAAAGEHAEVVHVRADGSETRRSYASLVPEASRVLGGLRALGLRPGDRVILQCEDTEDYLAALWGCILGGITAVPLTVPASYETASAGPVRPDHEADLARLLDRLAGLLLVGRTALPDEPDQEREPAADGPAADRVAAYRRLRALGEVRYEAADVTDPGQLRAAVDRARDAWSAPLAGVLHLAGDRVEAPVTELDPERWRSALAAKVEGGWVLYRLAAELDASYTAFSSVNGFFGGSLNAAYAAGCAFLDALAVRHGRDGRPVRSLAWSAWKGRGMSEGYRLAALTEARGYRALDAVAALRSYDLAASTAEPHLLIGADRTAPWVRAHLAGPARPVQRLAGRVVLADGADLGAVCTGAGEAARRLDVDGHWVLRAAGSAEPGGSAAPDGAFRQPGRFRPACTSSGPTR